MWDLANFSNGYKGFELTEMDFFPSYLPSPFLLPSFPSLSHHCTFLIRHVFCLETDILETQVIDQIISLLLHQNAMYSCPPTLRIHSKGIIICSQNKGFLHSRQAFMCLHNTINKYKGKQECGWLHVRMILVI